jgi:hypothetical protein
MTIVVVYVFALIVPAVIMQIWELVAFWVTGLIALGIWEVVSLIRKKKTITGQVREFIAKPENTWKTWLFSAGIVAFAIYLLAHFHLGW